MMYNLLYLILLITLDTLISIGIFLVLNWLLLKKIEVDNFKIVYIYWTSVSLAYICLYFIFKINPKITLAYILISLLLKIYKSKKLKEYVEQYILKKKQLL